jgi:hypothetical protein
MTEPIQRAPIRLSDHCDSMTNLNRDPQSHADLGDAGSGVGRRPRRTFCLLGE